MLAGGVTTLLSVLSVLSRVMLVESLVSSVVVLVLVLEQAVRNRTAAKKLRMFFMLLTFARNLLLHAILKKIAFR